MTPPMTPREKVEQAVKDAIREDAGVGLQMTLTPRFVRGLVDRVLSATSVVDHEAGLASDKPTALASGSGDHAELARLADEMVGLIAPSQGERLLEYERHQFDVASRIQTLSSTLLAENAALRAERDAMVEGLKDATTVHVNMLRGGIAKPPPCNIGHLYRGDEAKEVIAEVDRQNAGSNARATEAERKLAEAVGLLRKFHDAWRSGCGWLPSMNALDDEISAFLANQGSDQ